MVEQITNSDRTFRENPVLKFFVSGAETEIDISMFDRLTIELRPGHNGVVQAPIDRVEVGGAELKYIYNGSNSKIREYLKRLDVGAAGRLNCFVHAVTVAGINSVISDKINNRCYGRYLQTKHIKALIEEFDLNVEGKIWYSPDKSSTQIKAHKKDPISLSIFRSHYFIHESSPFTDYDLGVKFRQNRPIALGFEVFKDKCLQSVPAFGGIIKKFMSEAAHGGRGLIMKPGIYNNVSLLDVNSLYPFELSGLQIPTSIPKVWTVGINPLECQYSIVRINITSHVFSWYYPMIKDGLRTVDKYELEDLIKYCKI
jgi:hypothetical protein